MTRTEDERILDILESSADLAVFVSLGETRFESDWIVQRAAERLLEIIGEAANSLTRDGWESPSAISWRHMINLRHLLAHHYHRVDPLQVWQIASEEVPRLAQVLDDLRRYGNN